MTHYISNTDTYDHRKLNGQTKQHLQKEENKEIWWSMRQGEDNRGQIIVTKWAPKYYGFGHLTGQSHPGGVNHLASFYRDWCAHYASTTILVWRKVGDFNDPLQIGILCIVRGAAVGATWQDISLTR